MNERDNQTTLSVREILARAAREGLSLTSNTDEVDSMGLDFVVVHAREANGTAWVVRCPRRPDVIAGAAVEGRALALLAPRLPVAVPNWRVHTEDVIAYPRLPGTPAVTMGKDGAPTWNLIDPAAPHEAFIESAAALLAALQAVDIDAVRTAGVPVRTMADVRARWAETMTIARPLLSPTEATWTRWQSWLADDAVWPAHVALSHGDLHPGHLLLADDGRISGVLDWTETSVGDPGVDLAMFWGCFGAAALKRVLALFERAGGRVWAGVERHVAEQWFAFPAHAAAWAERTHQPAVLEFARQSLRASEGPV
ncbi:MAG TPA: macrolide 2'-phosphotransferase [Polyangia bacterium]